MDRDRYPCYSITLFEIMSRTCIHTRARGTNPIFIRHWKFTGTVCRASNNNIGTTSNASAELRRRDLRPAVLWGKDLLDFSTIFDRGESTKEQTKLRGSNGRAVLAVYSQTSFPLSKTETNRVQVERRGFSCCKSTTRNQSASHWQKSSFTNSSPDRKSRENAKHARRRRTALHR